ncbi:hypothetical protein BC831DRAFT_441658 [Entophlyctis helioformis]|nr:hypothetical protein BC831DRAFT_441658 [Entophlyctis helioformis]
MATTTTTAAAAAGPAAAGPAAGSLGASALQRVLSSSEREICDLYAAAVAQHAAKEAECNELCVRFKALQDDFAFNVDLIRQRDADLDSLEREVDALKAAVHDREARASELRLALREQLDDASVLKTALQTQELEHQEAVRRIRHEFEDAIQKKEDEMRRQNEAHESDRTSWAIKLKAAEQRLDLQRSSISTDMDAFKREMETNLRLHRQALDKQLMDAESRVAQRDAEIETLRLSRDTLKQTHEEQLAANRVLEKSVRDLQWELTDTNGMTAARIAELELVIKQGDEQATADAAQAEATMARTRHEYMQNMAAAKNESSKLAAQIASLHASLAEQEQRFKDAAKEHDDAVAALRDQLQAEHALVQQAQEELLQVRQQMDSEVQSLRKEVMDKGKELLSYRDKVSRLEFDLEDRQHDISVLKSQIVETLEEHRSLKTELVQNNLDWEARYAEMERTKTRDHEALVQSLMSDRQAAQSEIKALRAREHQHLLNTKHASQQQHDAQVQEYQSAIDRLSIENDHLKAVISDMRAEMESMTQQFQQSAFDTQHHNAYTVSGGGGGGGHLYPQAAWQADTTVPDTAAMHQHIHSLQALLQQKQALINQLLESQSQSETPFQLRFGDKANAADMQRQLDHLQSDNAILRRKLGQAVDDLRRLGRDKVQLVDMSNQLRAELRDHEARRLLHPLTDASTQTLHLQAQPPAQTPAPAKHGQQDTTGKPPLVTSSRVMSKPGTRPPHRQPSPASQKPLTDAEKSLLLKHALRSRGVRNWNEQQDD